MSVYNNRRSPFSGVFGDITQGSFGSPYMNFNQAPVVTPDTNMEGTPPENINGGVASPVVSSGVTEIATTATPEISIADRIGSFMARTGGDLGIVKPTSKLDALGQALAGIGRNISNSYVADKELEKKVKLDEMLAKRKADQEFEAKIGEYVYNADPETSKAFVEKVQDDIKAGTSRLEAMKNNQGLLRRGYASGIGGRMPKTPEELVRESRLEYVNRSAGKYTTKSIDKFLVTGVYGDLEVYTKPSSPEKKKQIESGWNKLNKTTLYRTLPDGEIEYKYAPDGPEGETSVIKTLDDITPSVAKGLELTESQGKVLGYYRLMSDAEETMAAMEAKGFDPTTYKNSALLYAASDVDGEGKPTAASALAYASLDAEGQKYATAQRQYVEGYGRGKSGGAIAKPEDISFARQSLTRFGETKEGAAYKRDSRRSTIRGMADATGNAAQYAIGDFNKRFGEKTDEQPDQVKVGDQTMTKTPTGYVNSQPEPTNKSTKKPTEATMVNGKPVYGVDR